MQTPIMRRVYVWEFPVRLYHWVNFACVLTLIVTGFVIGRPLNWVSDAIFLKLGDRFLIDGTPNGLAALAQGAAGRLSRVQSGSLHKYALFGLVGIVASLVWMWR